jgi:glycerol-1-phosphate dehydrogenase [NAD(P)+]
VSIFADPELAAGAPTELTQAGIGDLLAKASARVDWLAAHLLYGEDWIELAPPPEPEVEALLAGNVEATARLLGALIASGEAMAAVGSSRPASGCEHHASHFWDLLAARGQRPHHLHGLQVGYATHFAMALQQFAYAGEGAWLHPPTPPAEPLGAEARVWLGEPGPDITAAVEETRRAVTPVPAAWPADADVWRRVRAQLAPALRRFGAVGAALRAAAIPDEPGFLGIDERLLAATFRYATRLRGRFTVIDLLEGQGRLDEALAAVL